MVYMTSWSRPKTSAGLSTPATNDSSSTLPPNPLTTSSYSSSSAVAPAATGRLPADNGPSLNTRRSTHEFFHSARDAFHNTSRPRPSSSYLLQPCTTSQENHNQQSTPAVTSSRPSPSQPQRNRFRASIEDVRSTISSVARKALHNSTTRGMDLNSRPIDRLSSHDSSLSTNVAASVQLSGSDASSSGSASPSSWSMPVSTSPPPGLDRLPFPTFGSSSHPYTVPSTIPCSSTPAPLTSAGPLSPRAASIPNGSTVPQHKGRARLRSFRDRIPGHRRLSRGARDLLTQHHGDSSQPGSNGDAHHHHHPPQDDDVVMGNTPRMPPFSYAQVAAAGSAARAAAAEHNHGHSRSVNNAHDLDHSRFTAISLDRDEELSEADMHTFKRQRRSGKGKHVEEGDNGYDSMMDVDADMRDDEVMGGRRNVNPPPRRDIVGLLPNEIAVSILSYLDHIALVRCTKVSRRWRELAKAPAVWRTSFLGRYARAEENTLPYIQFGGQGLGRRINQPQEWQRMSKARLQIERNWQTVNPKAVYFCGHTDSVYCCQFDEDKIITGSRDRTIRVWDLNPPYACRKVIGGPAARPIVPTNDQGLDVHPTNTIHQTQNLNGRPEGERIYHIPSDYHTASILCLQFDKEIMVTGSSDHSCIVWDVNTFEPIQRLIHHSAGVLDVCMDDEYIISCSKDANICVWDRKTFRLIKALNGHRGPVNAVQLREIHGRKLLVSASGDGLAKIWDLGKLEAVMQFNSQDRGLAAVEFSDDGRHVLAGGNDQVIYKFDAASTELMHTFRGHTSLVRSLFLDSANGRVVSGSYDQGIRVFDFESGQVMGTYDNWTTSWILAAKGDYRRIVATSQDGRALLMDFGHDVPDVELLAGVEGTGYKGKFEYNYGGNPPVEEDLRVDEMQTAE